MPTLSAMRSNLTRAGEPFAGLESGLVVPSLTSSEEAVGALAAATFCAYTEALREA